MMVCVSAVKCTHRRVLRFRHDFPGVARD